MVTVTLMMRADISLVRLVTMDTEPGPTLGTTGMVTII